jgi:hypothetical protein
MPEWIASLSVSWSAVGWGLAIGAATFAISIFMVGFVCVRLPSNYFSDEHTSALVSDRHPALQVALRLGKNLLGVVLVIAGLIMFVTPGQGLLTVLVGILLLDFPGKRRLECKIVSRPSVLTPINMVRARFGKPPLVVGNGVPCPAPPRDTHEEQHVLPRH